MTKSTNNLLSSHYIWRKRIWKRLGKFDLNLQNTHIPLGFEFPELFYAKVYFDLQSALKYRGDFVFAISQDYRSLVLLSLTWKDTAAILFNSYLSSPTKMATIFNLEGNIGLKKEYVKCIEAYNQTIPRVLKYFCFEIEIIILIL